MRDDMPVNLKHRLLGAVVVLLLIIIFVPTLFDSGQDQSESVIATNIPPTSDEVTNVVFQKDADGEFKRVDIPLESLNEGNDRSSNDVTASVGVVTVAPESMALLKNQEAKNEPQSRVGQENIEVAVANKAPAESAPLVKPIATAAAPLVMKKDAERWMVQLGSFSKENNAKALHDKLRAKHFSVSLDLSVSADKKWWRVRVGPQPNKARALAVQKTLKKEIGLPGMVLQMTGLER